jgi:hypothetical protein
VHTTVSGLTPVLMTQSAYAGVGGALTARNAPVAIAVPASSQLLSAFGRTRIRAFARFGAFRPTA